MNFRDIYTLSERRNNQIEMLEKFDQNISKDLKKCPLVIATFLLNERQKFRNAHRDVSQTSFSNRLSKTSEYMVETDNEYNRLIEQIRVKGVCKALGEISVQQLLGRK